MQESVSIIEISKIVKEVCIKKIEIKFNDLKILPSIKNGKRAAMTKII